MPRTWGVIMVRFASCAARARLVPIAFATGLFVCLSASAAGRVEAPNLVAAIERVAALEPVKPSNYGATTIEAPHVSAPRAAAVPAGAGGLWRKWRAAEAAIAADIEVMAACRAAPQHCTSPAALHFNAIVDAARAQSGRARVGHINRAINLAIRPMSDMAQHGVEDVWSSPLATLTTSAGDCEDYAIAKYVALREAGFAADDVRLLVVRNAAAHEDHAVAAVRQDGRWLILDNRRMTLMEDRSYDLRPLFALDANGVKSLSPPTVSAAVPLAAADENGRGNGAEASTSGFGVAPNLM